MAGWFYLAVKVGRDLGDDYRDDLNVPVRLEVSITGAAEDGPDYAGSDGSGTFGQDAPRSEPQATGVTRTKMFPLGWVVGGGGAALVLVAMVGTAIAIRRRAAA